ncbi:MAG: class I SAM-dependent methyltransferase [Candidatus Eremiobacteraeota bacterium]|nr:class I SAM-dependent methyltransferase [Candidatus Eremiobacteraeota bacterium]
MMNELELLHSEIYRLPLYYDIAFDFRDIPQQADFLEEVFRDATGREPDSIIDLGCGPGYFVGEFAKRGKRSTGIDISSEMIEYARRKISKEHLTTELMVGDFLDFSLHDPVDMAILMLDSVGHILTNDNFIRHLECIASNLNSDGIYFIEFSHPFDEIIKDERRVKNHWVSERDGIVVETNWGYPSDKFDAIGQITTTTVSMRITDRGETFEIRETSFERLYTAQEVLALVRLSGVFDFVDWYGGFSTSQPLDNSRKSWRMNVVLRKRNKSG